jgi:hypothetical protein
LNGGGRCRRDQARPSLVGKSLLGYITKDGQVATWQRPQELEIVGYSAGGKCVAIRGTYGREWYFCDYVKFVARIDPDKLLRRGQVEAS